MDNQKSLAPTILVVFGISGDLSHRYLLPALANICKNSEITKGLKILGVSRRDIDVDKLFSDDQKNLKKYTQIMKMDLGSGADYERLKEKIVELGQNNPPQVMYYLSVPPAAVVEIIDNLGKAGLSGNDSKLLLEKPFGFNLDSARKLIAKIDEYFDEEQIYRIDHYLAKETVQNLVVLLGKNSQLKTAWDNSFIEKIEIIASEEIGIEGRVAFWESTGILRDFVQSHLLQLAALILMKPISNEADFDEIPDRRLAALRLLQLAADQSPIRAQYSGYAKEVNNPQSKVETFVSLTLESLDPRWKNVPIEIVVGKKLDKKLTQIKVSFKKTASSSPATLVFGIAPNIGTESVQGKKEAGPEAKSQKLKLLFNNHQKFGELHDPHAILIVAAMCSNHSLFVSSDEVLASWKILEPLLDTWSEGARDLQIYQPGATIEEVRALNN